MKVQWLHRFIFYLRANRTVNALLVALYFLFILFMHGHIVLLYLSIENAIGMATANVLVAFLFFAFTGTIGAVVFTHTRSSWPRSKKPFVYLIVTLLLIVLHSRFMFDSNIEVIHAMEFSLLSFLVFPMVNRFGFAILLTVPFMLIDEWYQYILLYPEWNTFFEFNDILMDTYGCAALMCILMLLGVRPGIVQPIWKRPEFYLIASAFILLLVLNYFGVIANYAHQVGDNTMLVLNERTSPEPFWRWHPSRQVWYHAMSPPEALLAITVALVFFMGIDGYGVSKPNAE